MPRSTFVHSESRSGPLRLLSHPSDRADTARLRLCAWTDAQDRFHCAARSGELVAAFGNSATTVYSPFASCETMTFAGDATLNDVVSAVLMFEGGPTSSVVECSLLGRRITLDLFRPTPEFVVVRLDQVDVCDLHTLWGPLEIHTLGEKNHRAHGSQCVVSGIFTDYPRVLASTRSVSRFKLPGVDWSYGDNGDALVDRGVCILSNPQRAVVEIVSHEWAGIIVVRRGPLLNAADLYSSQRRRGLIIGESCDIVIGRNTGLGPGESPLFGAFADIFNP